MQQHGRTYYLQNPQPPDRGWGQKVKILLSEHCHVVYQIKKNHGHNNIMANILPAETPILEIGSIGQN